ncbi:MAG: hypothetical protein HYZ88_02745 [Candidatus Omnitrophica bacterium]|nr:hypothetical protein [Candidatus Omnitrophota bacterium]
MKGLKFFTAFCFLLTALGLSSCGSPSYPKAGVAEALVKICREEYKLEVQAQLKGTTLGVLAPIPGLVEALRKSSGASAIRLPGVVVEGRYAENRFGFRVFAKGPFTRAPKRDETDRPPQEPEEAIKKLQHVSTALHRVCLSTDAPVEFYQMIARDPGPENLDIIFSGHVMDSKRMQFYEISMGEMQSRSQFGVRLQPEGLARQTVAAFLADLRRVPLPKLLSSYTASTKRFGDLLPKILLAAVDLKGREQELIDEDWPVKQIGRETVLVYVPLAPIDEPGALLFYVEVRETSSGLLDIERLPGGKLPPEHKALGPPEQWKNSFFLEALSMPDFLAEQIARRAMSEFQPLESEEEQPEGGQKKRKPKEKPKPVALQDVARTLVETTAYVTQSYEFKTFQDLSVVDALKGTQWMVPAADLPLYRRRNHPELKPIP